MASKGNAGLGGLIRENHVNRILKRSGNEVLQSQIMNQPNLGAKKAKHKTLSKCTMSKKNVEEQKMENGKWLTAHLMAEALRKANAGAPKNKNDRQKRLLEYFQGKPESLVIVFYA